MRQLLPMVLVRIIVSLVFVLEGALKFVDPAQLGAGRFFALGLPYPEQLAPLVGGIEIAGGLAILFNFMAGEAAVALLLVILTALATTKLPILLGHKLGPLGPVKLDRSGILNFLHEARTDLAMLFGLIAILIDSGLKVGRRRHWYQGRG